MTLAIVLPSENASAFVAPIAAPIDKLKASISAFDFLSDIVSTSVSPPTLRLETEEIIEVESNEAWELARVPTKFTIPTPGAVAKVSASASTVEITERLFPTTKSTLRPTSVEI